MAHGRPDYSVAGAKVTTYGLDDMAELAARLGTPDKYNRSGDVVFMDSFEGGVQKWFSQQNAARTTLTQDPNYAVTGAFSMKVALAADSKEWCDVTHMEAYPVLGKMGFELKFTWDNDCEVGGLYILTFDGTTQRTAGCFYDKTVNELQYINSAGSFVALATSVTLQASNYLFHVAKMVLDYDTNKYVKFYLDNNEYSLADIAFRTSSSSTNPYQYFRWYYIPPASTALTFYLEDCVITQNEP